MTNCCEEDEIMSVNFEDTASLHQFYEQLVIRSDPINKILYCFADPKPRPCFTPELISDLAKFLRTFKNQSLHEIENQGELSYKYLVLGSHRPGVFSLGGDLELFLTHIKNSDRDCLTQYVRSSIQVLYEVSIDLGFPITTIALVRGNALGAGFEGALACDVIIAEKNVQLGFPEVLFNMFPGMGAYSFLVRRIDPIKVEKMILSGRIYTAAELFEMGIIDVLAEMSSGQEGLRNYIKKHTKSDKTRKSLFKIRNRVLPVTLEELFDIGDIWIDAALSLGERELRIMERLIKSQNKVSSQAIDRDIVS